MRAEFKAMNIQGYVFVKRGKIAARQIWENVEMLA